MKIIFKHKINFDILLLKWYIYHSEQNMNPQSFESLLYEDFSIQTFCKGAEKYH